MWALTPAGADPNRAYYGTDARAQALLVGAGLAVALALWPNVGPTGCAGSGPWSGWPGSSGPEPSGT